MFYDNLLYIIEIYFFGKFSNLLIKNKRDLILVKEEIFLCVILKRLLIRLDNKIMF